MAELSGDLAAAPFHKVPQRNGSGWRHDGISRCVAAAPFHKVPQGKLPASSDTVLDTTKFSDALAAAPAY